MRTNPDPPSDTLGQVPNNCAPGPLPAKFTSSFGPGLGNSLFKVGVDGTWDGRSYLRIHLSKARRGWYIKLIWLIPRDSTQDVRVRMWNLGTGKAVVFIGDRAPDPTTVSTTVNLLSRNHAGDMPGDWIPSGFNETIFPSAGCYALFAQWKGGAYLASLAAGR